MRQVNQVKLGEEFINKREHRESHDRCLWAARMRRDTVAASIPQWEEMRALASDIRKHVLSNLDQYLEQFAKNAESNGFHVHWAKDADEHNRIILDIFKKRDVKVVTKGKSMTMDECGMREFLEKEGIEINEADLGERIQQLDDQRPSHIVMPAIHKLRSDVADIFARKLGSDRDIDDPHYLNSVMRADMRKRYVRADAGMNGVNFGIAETGGITVCTNEGNADISANLPPLFVASMGIEKILPRQSDLALFIRLLSRSALGLDITQYTSHYHGPRKGQEAHIVILDNGRSDRLSSSDYWEVLKCIRCGTCMNTCPVFRRTSGISYDATYMGPIGIVLEPSYDLYKYARLPYSCTHCGSCGDVCPVQVPIPRLILYWRDVVVKQGYGETMHNLEQAAAEPILKNSRNLMLAEKIGLWALKNLPKGLTESPLLNPWAKEHTNPEPPKETFRQYYNREIKPQIDADGEKAGENK
ncbi:MAG: lactate utilization protein [Desulfovibrio sp.]|nr:lactate utilization protein [Desulfovibrio sp.]